MFYCKHTIFIIVVFPRFTSFMYILFCKYLWHKTYISLWRDKVLHYIQLEGL